jgi:ribosomal protein L7/L12
VIEMLAAMATGRKIEAIKYCRALTGQGLKEAKDMIEAAQSPRAA